MISQHTSLLQTASELRNELEKCLVKIADLESENIRLQESHRVVEDQLLETNQNYREARKAYLHTVNEKINQESMFESFITKVKHELSEKSKEFDLLREKFSPQDLELIRIKIQEEIEIRFTGKIIEANAEVEHYKNQALALRRELEKAKSILETKEAVYKRDFESALYENEAVIQQLRNSLAILENEKKFPDQAESGRHLKYQIDELRATVSQLQTEAQILNGDKIALQADLEESRSVVEQLKVAHRQKLVSFESQRVEADVNVRLLQSELSARELALSTVQRELESLASEDRRKSALVQSLQQGLEDKGSMLHTTLSDQSKQLQLENARLTSEVSRLTNYVSELEGTVRSTQKENAELLTLIERNDAKMRRTHQSEVQKLTDRILQDEIYLAARDGDVRSLQTRYNKLNESYSIDIDVLKNEITKLKKENSILNSRSLSTEQKVAQ